MLFFFYWAFECASFVAIPLRSCASGFIYDVFFFFVFVFFCFFFFVFFFFVFFFFFFCYHSQSQSLLPLRLGKANFLIVTCPRYLSLYGFEYCKSRSFILDWIFTLSDKYSLLVILNRVLSNKLSVLSGVTQGFCLWLVLSQVYIKDLRVHGPVVQSIVSLTSSLVVKMLTVLVDTISNIFAEKKMWVAF